MSESRLAARTALCAAALLAAIFFAAFVWPTRYAYDARPVGNAILVLKRDRLTGRMETIVPPVVDQWAAQGAAATPPPRP